MKPYRNWRSRQFANHARLTRHGFEFAGYPIFFQDEWEVCERKIIGAVLPSCRVFLDIGASHGFYSCLAAQAGLIVAAVEAERNSSLVLQANVRRNGFTKVEVFPVAVAQSVGVADLYGDGDCASLDLSWAGVGAGFRQLVPTNTIDNLFADRWSGNQLAIKVDVEGLEKKVLDGGTRLIRRAPKPFWLIETFPRASDSSSFLEVFSIMFAAGYKAFVADEARTPVTTDLVQRWAENPKLPGRAGSNFIFVDADRANWFIGGSAS